MGNTGSARKGRTVTFASNLETVHFFDTNFEETEDNGFESVVLPSSVATSQLTEEMKLLSTEHGRARRYLREIPKVSLKAAVKYGRKEQNRLGRWKYTFQNVVCITDAKSKVLITCYKEPVSIAAAPISDDMWKRHEYVKRIIKEEPRMCTSHFVVIVDQSGSMRNSDVNAFRNRSNAAYGCLALDFVAEQLVQEDDTMVAGIDTFTLIEMNKGATVIFDEEPLDWILFNKILERQTKAKPMSHGNYGPSIRAAKNKIYRCRRRLEGIGTEDLPAFVLVLLSDGKPSDNTEAAKNHIRKLSLTLKEKFSFFTMGIGGKASDFAELEKLTQIAIKYGGKGEFNHLGCSAANLGDTFSRISSSMSTVRSGLLSKSEIEIQKDDKKPVLPLKGRPSVEKSLARGDAWKAIDNVTRFKWKKEENEENEDDEDNHLNFYQVEMMNKKTVGFAMDKIAFGKGTERLAYRFQELDDTSKTVGKLLVAKETKGVRIESKKLQFHKQFCRVQSEAYEATKNFNRVVFKTQTLKPAIDGNPGPPKISFLQCSVYRYLDKDSEQEASILVEKYLKGKFTKYNGNNGFVNKKAIMDSPTVDLKAGKARLTDFLHAFSHWTYVNSNHKLLLCDLQGVLNQEGLSPQFLLTDPAFCSDKQKSLTSQCFGGTADIGLKGIRSFFRTHQCNIVCKCLGLPGAKHHTSP